MAYLFTILSGVGLTNLATLPKWVLTKVRDEDKRETRAKFRLQVIK